MKISGVKWIEFNYGAMETSSGLIWWWLIGDSLKRYDSKGLIYYENLPNRN